MTISILPALLIFILAPGKGKAEEGQIVHGAFVKEINSPIFYSSFIPIVHEFVVPKWKDGDLRLKWPLNHSSICNDSPSPLSYFDYGKLEYLGCPSVYHYNTVLTNLYKKMEWKKPSLGSGSDKSITGALKISCDEILTHFVATYVNSEDWRNYWKILTNCPLGESVILKPSEKFSTINLDKLNLMLSTYWTEYAVHLHETEAYTGGAVYTNAYSAYQAVAMIAHSVEMNRWRDAVTECESKRLPRSLIEETTIKTALIEASHKVNKKHMNLSLPDSEVSPYYTLPLTNCIYSEENTSYVIRTLAPVISSRSAYKLVELESIPFSYEFNSTAATNLICNLEGIEGRYIFDEMTHGLITKTDCKSLELCFIPAKGTLPIVDPCVAAVFENDTEIIKKLCKSKCVHIPTKHFPVFRHLTSDKYSIAGISGSNLEIFLNCHAKPYKVLLPNETGALEITLPCHCKIVYQSEELHSYQPCGEKLLMRYIQPLVRDQNLIQPEPAFKNGAMIISEDNPETTTDITSDKKLTNDLKQLTNELNQWKNNSIAAVSIMFIMLTFTVIGLVMLSRKVAHQPIRHRDHNETSSGFNDRVLFQNDGKDFDDPIMLLH